MVTAIIGAIKRRGTAGLRRVPLAPPADEASDRDVGARSNR